MARSLKIVVTGPFGAGKSSFIRTISEIDVVATERRISTATFDSTVSAPRSLRSHGQPAKPYTTVAMDYGRLTLGDDVLHLHGTPGQARFDFMWDILAREMAGFVLMVDAAAPDTFAEARDLLGAFTAGHRTPFVVAANKQDLPGAAKPEKLRMALGLSGDTLILPCTATRKTSVRQVLSQLMQLI
ncbi:MAG: ATP/GTP-binding protein [Anaerolineales bacterium]|nr:ATP/GTP-binding protein [Anaerolineales bacterium]